MSVQAMAWALDHRQTGPLAPEARLVLVSLADYTDPTGRNAWPSAATLAARLGVTLRSVRRSLAALEDLGLIRHGDQAVVAHLRADRRPVVWDLALDGIQVTLKVDGSDVQLSAEPYDRDRHGVTALSPREPVDNQPRGDAGGRHGVTATSPKPSTNPLLSTPSVVKVTQRRASASASHAVPREPGARVRSLGLTDPNCPTCGERVHRTHRCRSSALTTPVLVDAATIREQLAAAPRHHPETQLELEVALPPRGPCDWCGRLSTLNDLGVCIRCAMAVAKVGPHPHDLEIERLP